MLLVYVVGAMIAAVAWTASGVMRQQSAKTRFVVAVVSGVFVAYGFAAATSIGAPFAVLGLAGVAGTMLATKDRIRIANAFLGGFAALTALLLVLPH